ncbi:MAG: methyltransferase [Oscillospiraceae bacterium]|nr:methyltransferase [Oscillospiraceae bacterium]
MNDYYSRLRRTLAAVDMKPVDKIPYSYSGPAYVAKRQKLPMKDYISDFPRAAGAVVDFLKAHPGIDSLHTPITAPYLISTTWLSKVCLPGIELPDDELWQVDEREVLLFDDYNKILETGYGPWVDEVLKNRLGDPLGKAKGFFEYQPEAVRRVAEAGVPVFSGVSYSSPLERFCGGRTLMKFFLDLHEEPDLIKRVFDAVQEYLLGEFISAVKRQKPIATWIGGWRVAPELMSHEMWTKYAWAYLKPAIIAATELGVVPVLHFDSSWDREIETLRELPPRKCILMLDGKTDMRRARAILDDRMCLLGDVPAGLLAFGTASEVYNYVTKLIEDVGPKTGLIVSSGCDNPINAKDDNVDAMIQATADYAV